MKMTNEELGCSFEVPDRPTVRQQLQWYASMTRGDAVDRFVANWEAAQPLISGWECEALPDRSASLDSLSNPTQTRIVLWVQTQVLVHMNGLDDVPKN